MNELAAAAISNLDGYSCCNSVGARDNGEQLSE